MNVGVLVLVATHAATQQMKLVILMSVLTVMDVLAMVTGAKMQVLQK